ncbi:polysaccharide deacetylase family protein [Corynebacterium sp. Q4381]|uniref:polysaccharide deacetylase family protein n=1 Tax=Corynebacterium sp. Marseille-Q4381 TaxID=3121597 RepID=UPI002FE4FF4F
MAETITLTGRLTDITSRPVERITRISVKSPVYGPGPGIDLTTSQPVAVEASQGGTLTIQVVEGVGWLFVEGDGWSDSIRFVAAPGMSTLWEAVVNALPHTIEVKNMLIALGEAYEASQAGQALPPWLTEAALNGTYATKQEFLAALQDKVEPLVMDYLASDRAVTDAAIAAIEKQVPGAVDAYVKGQVTWRGVVGNTVDLNAVRDPGFYTVPSSVVGRSLDAWPDKFGGVLAVYANKGTSVAIQEAIVSQGGSFRRYLRYSAALGADSWTPWEDQSATGVLPSGTDLQKWRAQGAYQVSLTESLKLLDMPKDADGNPVAGQGVVETLTAAGTGMAMQRMTINQRSGGLATYVRFTSLTSGWPEWQRIGGGSSAGGGQVASPQATARSYTSSHAARVEYAKTRRGGSIGTGGKPVVMLRFDHWLVAFRDKVLPILEKYQLPATLNLNHDNLELEQNGSGSITWEHIQDWNQYKCIEIANHGSTHRDQSTTEGIFHEIVNGRRNLEKAMPRVAVEAWQEHGASYFYNGDIDGDIGLDLGRTLANYTDSYAGQLVLSEHAVVEGKSGGFFHPLTGTPQIGQSHFSFDRSTAAEMIAQVDTVETVGGGVTLYAHPGSMQNVLVGGKNWPWAKLPDGRVTLTDPKNGAVQTFASEQALRDWAGANGNIVFASFDDFDVFCAELARRRDEGRLMVMTATGGGVADSSHARRRNLLVKPDFTDGHKDWWTYMTGWTVTNPGPDVTLTSTGSAQPLGQSMLLYSRFGWAMGAAHELVVTASATTPTTLTLQMHQLGKPENWNAQREFEVPGDGKKRAYRLNLTLPRDKDISQMTIRIGGPSLTIHGAPLLAAI